MIDQNGLKIHEEIVKYSFFWKFSGFQPATLLLA